MGLDTTTLNLASSLLSLFGLWWFLRRGDEVPLAITGFNFLFIRRLGLVEGGVTRWADYDYGLLFSFSDYSHEAATYMLMGALVLTATFCILVKRRVVLIGDSDETLNAFLLRQRGRILAGFVLFSIVNALVRPSFAPDNPEDYFISGYAYQFTLAHSSFILLLTLLVVYAQSGTIAQKGVMLGIIVVTGILSIAPSLRFAILGWVIPLAFVFTARFKPSRKLFTFALFGVVIAFVFTIAGLYRFQETYQMEPEQVFNEAGEALFAGGDVNMLDGFTMLIQVYPRVLPYGLGREHLEILTRPIPRSLWPDKPVGGWTQKFAQMSGVDYFTTGISPSLYGSFYGEGGVIGVIVLSALYGWLFARYTNFANSHGSILRWALRGVLIASLFALMRGGDIPGIAAFLGMSYWPLALFVWDYRRKLRAATAKGRLGAALQRYAAGDTK